MKKLIKSLTVLAICIFFYDTTSAQVTYDYDKEANFTQYKTYSFGGWQEDSDKLINDLDKKRKTRNCFLNFFPISRIKTLFRIKLYFFLENQV